MLEKLIVGIVVASAFAYAAWALLPRGSRQRLAGRLVDATGGPQATGALAKVSQALLRAAGGGAQCHGCDAHAPDAPDTKRTPQ